MKSILIKDTTREEREQIVRQSLWGDCGIECEFCSGCDNRGGGEHYLLFISHISMARRRYTRSMRNTARHLYADNRRAGLLSFQRVED